MSDCLHCSHKNIVYCTRNNCFKNLGICTPCFESKVYQFDDSIARLCVLKPSSKLLILVYMVLNCDFVFIERIQ